MKTNTSSTEKADVKEQRNKATICATVSPWLKTRLERMVDGKEFSSVSDRQSAMSRVLDQAFP